MMQHANETIAKRLEHVCFRAEQTIHQIGETNAVLASNPDALEADGARELARRCAEVLLDAIEAARFDVCGTPESAIHIKLDDRTENALHLFSRGAATVVEYVGDECGEIPVYCVVKINEGLDRLRPRIDSIRSGAVNVCDEPGETRPDEGKTESTPICDETEHGIPVALLDQLTPQRRKITICLAKRSHSVTFDTIIEECWDKPVSNYGSVHKAIKRTKTDLFDLTDGSLEIHIDTSSDPWRAKLERY